MLSCVTTPQDLDERFREAVGGLAVPGEAVGGWGAAEPGEARTGPAPGTGVRPEADEPVRDGTTLTAGQALKLYDAQLTSRHLDLAARWLRSFGEGYYTIGSAGHEGNAAVAAAVRPTDPALLHYRSGGFYCARAAQVSGGADGADPISRAARDVLRGVVASTEDPITGGRYKVFGNPDLAVVPTTSTIASHLPRAVGVGFAIERLRRLRAAGKHRGRAGLGLLDRGLRTAASGGGTGGWVWPDAEPAWPDDAIVVCSFGDASVNHASAQAAFNTTGWCDHTGLDRKSVV